MSLFREYATSIAFRVDLTKSMAATLWVINEYELFHQTGKGNFFAFNQAKAMIGSQNDPFTAASRALMRRGLVVWKDLPKQKNNPKLSDWSAQTWRMTEAGRHVLALCQLAEIVPASSKPKLRAVA